LKREETETKSSIYWHGEEEQAYYEELKETARGYGFKSFSDFAKLMLGNPLMALKTAWNFLPIVGKDLDFTDTWTFVEGGVPDRDMIQKEAEKMTVEQLQKDLIAQKAAENLIDSCRRRFQPIRTTSASALSSLWEKASTEWFLDPPRSSSEPWNTWMGKCQFHIFIPHKGEEGKYLGRRSHKNCPPCSFNPPNPPVSCILRVPHVGNDAWLSVHS
jgi:hypothetical protein